VMAATVYNNGYKGKRWTGGDDIATEQYHELKGDLIYSTGDSKDLSGYYNPDWTTYMANWTAADLPVPAGATIEKARLYIYYNFDKTTGGDITNYLSMSFNTNPVAADAVYTDRKGFGSYDHPSGTIAYDVTGYFNPGATNEMVLSNSYPGNVTIAQALLVVIYGDNSKSMKQIWINEGCDILSADKRYCVVADEATAYAPFAGTIDPSEVVQARLITVVQSGDAGSGNKQQDRLYFNGNQIGADIYNAGYKIISIDDRSVDPALLQSSNVVSIQSYDGTYERGDYMTAANAFLVLEQTPPDATVYFEPEDIRLPKKGDTTNVSIWIDTSEALASGLVNFSYTCCCANVTAYYPNETNWNAMNEANIETCGKVIIGVANTYPAGIGPGLVHIGDFTIECCGDSYCETELYWDATSSYLQNTSGDNILVDWKDGTFKCNIPDLVMTDVRGVEIDETHYNVTCTVKNVGEVNASASSACLMVDDSQVETISVPELGPGEEFTGSFTSEIELTGDYDILKVCADCNDAVVELDETNNCMIGRYPGEVVISVVPEETIVQPQDQFDVKIHVDPRRMPVYAVQYSLSYGTDVVRAETQTKGPFLGDISETIVIVNDIDQPSGEISYAETRKVQDGVDEDGNVTTIQFTAIGPRNATTTLRLHDVIISDEDGNAMAYRIENGCVKINENRPPVANGTSKHRINNVAKKYQSTAVLCSCSYDPDYPGKGGNITYIRWAFGDGQYGTSEGLVENCTCKEHKYESWLWNSTANSYDPFIAVLTVTDDGCPELSNSTEFPVTVYIAGDANGDGEVNVLDAVWVGRHWREECNHDQCDPCYGYLWDDPQADGADLNNDCEINVLDAVIIGANWRHTAW